MGSVQTAVFVEKDDPQKLDFVVKSPCVEIQHLPFCTSAVCQILMVCASTACSTCIRNKNKGTVPVQ